MLNTVCSEEFTLADGIKVSKLDYNHAKDEASRYKAALKSEERLLEHQLELKEKKLTKDFFPTSCQGKLFSQNLCLAVFICKFTETKVKVSNKHHKI